MPSKQPKRNKESATRRPLEVQPGHGRNVLGAKGKTDNLDEYGSLKYDTPSPAQHHRGGRTQEERAPPAPGFVYSVPAAEIGFSAEPLHPQDDAHHFQQPESCMDNEQSDSSLEEGAGSFSTGHGEDRRIGNRESSKRSRAPEAGRQKQNPTVESDFVTHAAPVGSEVRRVKATAPRLLLSGEDPMSEDEDMPVQPPASRTRSRQQSQLRESESESYAEVRNSRATAPQWPREGLPVTGNREPPLQPPDAPGTRRRRYDQKAESDEYCPTAYPQSRHVRDKPQEGLCSRAFIPEAACSPRRNQPQVVRMRPKIAPSGYGTGLRDEYCSPAYPQSRHVRDKPQEGLCSPAFIPEAACRPRRDQPQASQVQQHFIAFFVLLAIIFLFVQGKDLFSNQTKEESELNVTDVIVDLKSKFPDQPQMSFRVIHSAIRNVFQPEPKAPAIIMLLAANGSESTCDRFAHELVNSLSSPNRIVQISGRDYEAESANIAKKEIDDMINKTLTTDQMGAVLVDGLDRIPGEAALIFHTYCDHENAPFKRAVYVMTVFYGKTIHGDADPKSWDKALQDHLYGAWANVGVDQVSPLLSRLTVSVAAITAKTV